jgi:hypothetical protein
MPGEQPVLAARAVCHKKEESFTSSLCLTKTGLRRYEFVMQN